MFERTVATACTTPRLRTKRGVFPLREEALAFPVRKNAGVFPLCEGADAFPLCEDAPTTWGFPKQIRQLSQRDAILRTGFSSMLRCLSNANALQTQTHGLRKHRGGFTAPSAKCYESCGGKQKHQRGNFRSYCHAQASLMAGKGSWLASQQIRLHFLAGE